MTALSLSSLKVATNYVTYWSTYRVAVGGCLEDSNNEIEAGLMSNKVLSE